MTVLDPGGTTSNDHAIDPAEPSSGSLAAPPSLPDLNSSTDSLIGMVIDQRFKIVSRLGSGGMSQVYKAEHLIMQKDLAVKVLHPEESAKANSMERFQQEARAISALDHASIVRVYAFGCSDAGKLYLAMDYLEGPSLAELISREGALDWQRVARLCMQMAEGLDHAHRRGVIHRDLKPSNVIVLQDASGNETVKIVDFGIARLTEQSGKEARQLTLAGNTCGSPPYMSPEQCRGDLVDQRSDIYSFGCMIYEMLSGRRPFYAATNMELMHKHIKQSPKYFKLLSADLVIPHSLEAIVRKCLEKDPANRYQRMQDLHDDLAVVGTASKSEELLKKSLQSDAWKDLRSRVSKIALAILLPLTLLAVLSVFLVSNGERFFPQAKIWRLQYELASVLQADPNRFNKLFSLLPQLVELEEKQGTGGAALMSLRALEKELRLQPVSRNQSHLLAKLARIYNRLGKTDEARALTDEILANLQAYIHKCNEEKNFADLEPAALEVLSICRDDIHKQDQLLGQYNMLIPMYIWRQKYELAEKLSHIALQQIQSAPQTNESNEIIMLLNLSESLMPQAKFKQAEEALERAWELCLKGWTPESPMSQKVGGKLLECYRAEGKEKEAKELSAVLKQ